MIHKDKIPAEFLPLVEQKLESIAAEIEFPPPVFTDMEGEVIAIDLDNGTLTNKFPILHKHLNPFGNMQGGIISAAIDNTIGPLSMLVAPINFTRSLELKYGKAISPSIEFIYVTAQFIEKRKRQLFFECVVRSPDGEKLASAKAMHWIIDPNK